MFVHNLTELFEMSNIAKTVALGAWSMLIRIEIAALSSAEKENAKIEIWTIAEMNVIRKRENVVRERIIRDNYNMSE